MKKFLLAILAAAALAGCTDTQMAHLSALNNPSRITLYSANGTIINQWTSTGKVQNGTHSDGYEFENAATHHLVQVSGTVVVEVQ